MFYLTYLSKSVLNSLCLGTECLFVINATKLVTCKTCLSLHVNDLSYWIQLFWILKRWNWRQKLYCKLSVFVSCMPWIDRKCYLDNRRRRMSSDKSFTKNTKLTRCHIFVISCYISVNLSPFTQNCGKKWL